MGSIVLLLALSSANAAEPLSLDRWQRHVIDAAKPWRSVFVAAADLDSDGLPDVVTGGWWYRNPGSSATAWERHSVGTPLHNMAAVADFDGDGDLDILGTGGKGSESSTKIVWARNRGGGSFEILQNVANGQGDFLQGVAVAEFLKPGQLSVALSWHRAGAGIQVLRVPPHAAQELWTSQIISEISQDEQVSAGQIGGSGRIDLLLGTKWLENQGDRWSLREMLDEPGVPDRNRLADMNLDGKLDAVVGYQAINRAGKLAWYQQPTSLGSHWKEHLIANVVGPMSVDVGDFDRDGDPDIVVGEHNYDQPETARLIVFENQDGVATSWKQHVVHTGDEHHDGAVMVDIDNDGDSDIVSIGWKEPEVWLYENKAIDQE